jgi:hypothetical protein
MVGVHCADDVTNPDIRRMNLGCIPPVLCAHSTYPATLFLSHYADPRLIDPRWQKVMCGLTAGSERPSRAQRAGVAATGSGLSS